MANKDLSFLTNSTSSRLEATALEKQKREAELQEMRRLRAEALAANASNPDWDNGSAPITDIEGWRNEQKLKVEEERRKKMEAAEGLHGYRGMEVGGSKKAGGKDGKVFKAWEGKGQISGGEEEEGVEVQMQENSDEAEVEESCVDVKGAVGKFEQGGAGVGGSGDNNDDAAEDKTEEQPFDCEPEPAEKSTTGESAPAVVEATNSTEEKEAVDGLIDLVADTSVSYVDKEENSAPAAEDEETVEKVEEVAATDEPPVEEEEVVEPEPKTEEPTPQPAEEPVIEEEPTKEEEPQKQEPPTYSRTDVKFSFGLIVRSNHPTGNFDENLRENETLRKCMASTSKILKREMPSPPEVKEDDDLTTVDYSSFPKAYYDPSLEPTVLSIEEDTSKDSTEMMERGNKRTLVKASFPVFLQNVEGDGSDGDSKALLKETKSTVFKALRAAVSGGQFLR
jgi:hypothetical protein